MRLHAPLLLLSLAPLLPAQDVWLPLPDGRVLAGDAVHGDLEPWAVVPAPIGQGARLAGTLHVGSPDGTVWRVTANSVAPAFSVPGGASVLAPGEGETSLLVAGSDGIVRRVDPASGKARETHDAPEDATCLLEVPFVGLFAGSASGFVWLESGGAFERLADAGDPVVGLAVVEDHLYVTTAAGDLLDLSVAGAHLATHPLGARARGLAAHLTDLLVPLEDGRLLRLDRETGVLLDVEATGEAANAVVLDPGPITLGWAYCYGDDCPCGNDDPANGCANSTGLGGYLLASGSRSVSADDLSLVLTHLPADTLHVLVMSRGWTTVDLGDGLLCIDTTSSHHRFAPGIASAAGYDVLGPGLVQRSTEQFPGHGHIQAGDTWHFQAWYRDDAGPCGSGFNVTNAYSVSFEP